MGQPEVYNWLKNKRECGDNSFFSRPEIERGLKEIDQYFGALRVALVQLESYGYLEFERRGHLRDWQRCYRVKKKYCNGALKK